MSTQVHQIPPMPVIGRPESYYAQLEHCAQRSGLSHHHEAAKVGQYITLALDPSLEWPQKLKYFQHVLKRHCVAPPLPDDAVWVFYQDLADLVRSYCGREALRIASIEDDIYATRERMGQPREKIENDAELFFEKIMGHSDHRPDYFSEGDWAQLKLLRNQWI